MAKNRGRGRKSRGRALPAFLIVLLLLGGLFGWMYVSAALVHVRPAEIFLPDLPAPFDGTTALFVSDVNVRSAREARSCARLMEKLESLAPDLLLLGGDYSSGNLLDALNNDAAGDDAPARAFLQSLANFRAPLGKFAVLGEADDADALANTLSAANILPLEDDAAIVERDGARLAIVGIRNDDTGSASCEQIARSFRAEDCVLVMAHNPLSYTRIRMEEAQGGGAWADLVLSGHTLGGQIKLFGRTLRSLTEKEARRIAGWYYADDLPTLVSQGLSCRGARLRLGTQSEVWLLTLRRAEKKSVGF